MLPKLCIKNTTCAKTLQPRKLKPVNQGVTDLQGSRRSVAVILLISLCYESHFFYPASLLPFTEIEFVVMNVVVRVVLQRRPCGKSAVECTRIIFPDKRIHQSNREVLIIYCLYVVSLIFCARVIIKGKLNRSSSPVRIIYWRNRQL